MNKKIKILWAFSIISIVLIVCIFFACEQRSDIGLIFDNLNLLNNSNQNIAANLYPKLFFNDEYLYVSQKFQSDSGKYVSVDKTTYINMGKDDLILGTTEFFIVYYKNHSILNIKNKVTEEVIIVDDCVELVQFDNENLFYQKECKLGNTELWCYNLNTLEYELLAKDVETFALDGDYIWLVNKAGQNDSLFQYEIVKLCLKEKGIEPIKSIENNERVFCILASEEFIILSFNTSAEILIINKANPQDYFWPKIEKGAGNVALNFNKKYLFFSYSIYQLTDLQDIASVGSIGKGLYRYDFYTHECEKISNITFDKLYVFNDSLIWGTCDEDLYCITNDGSLSVSIR